jgi:hypothetical protein
MLLPAFETLSVSKSFSSWLYRNIYPRSHIDITYNVVRRLNAEAPDLAAPRPRHTDKRRAEFSRDP